MYPVSAQGVDERMINVYYYYYYYYYHYYYYCLGYGGCKDTVRVCAGGCLWDKNPLPAASLPTEPETAGKGSVLASHKTGNRG